MDEPTLESSFERYRSTGDLDALGGVFDRAAPDLWRFARRLVRSKSAADDLVQETFLVVIESAARFEAGRPLLPWMAGILARRASFARRREQRPLDASRVPAPSAEPSPSSTLEAAEIEAAVADAFARLPTRYARIVGPRLVDGVGGAELARRLGRDPATVRSQLARGLALLRGFLPQGIAGIAVALSPRRALGAIRERVLHAAASAHGSSTAAVSSLGVLGGWSMAARVALVSALTVSAMVTFFTWPRTGTTQPAVVAGAESATPTPAPAVPRIAGNEPTERRPVSPAPDRLGSYRGRLVTADERPLADVPVALWEASIDRLTDAHGPRDLVTASTRTAADGTFVVTGARGGRLHALSIDEGGPHAALHGLVEEPTLDVDLGTIAVPARVRVTGRVVDAQGRGLARVSVVALASPRRARSIVEALAEVRAGVPLAIHDDETAVVAPAAWVADLARRLPWRATTTDADGAFALDDVAIGLTTFGASCDGSPRIVTSTHVAIGRTATSLPALVVERSSPRSGRVVDPNGHAVADAVVLAGVRPRDAAFTSLPCTARSDANGQFTLDGFAADAELTIAVRAHPASDWSTKCTSASRFDISIDDAPVELGCTWADGAGGAIERVGIEAGRLRSELPLEPATVELPRDHWSFENDTIALRGLATGTYRVVVESEDGRIGAVEFTAARGGRRATVELGGTLAARVRVVDASTQSPRGGSEVRMRGARNRSALATTDADGVARFEPDRWNSHVVVDANPRTRAHGTITPATVVDIVAEIDAAAAIAGTVRVDPDDTLTHVAVFDRGADGLARFARIGPDGSYRIDGLEPGVARVEGLDAPSATDPLALVFEWADWFDAALGARDVTLEPGAIARVDLDLRTQQVPMPTGTGTRIEGSITESGRACAGMHVVVRSAGRDSSTITDARGRYVLTGFKPGDVVLRVARSSVPREVEPTLVHAQRFVIADGATRTIDVDFAPFAARVRVEREGTGAPCPGARIELALVAKSEAKKLLAFSAGRFAGITDAAGVARIEVPRAAEYFLHATDAQSSVATRVTIDAANPECVVRLDGWLLAGTLIVEPSIDPNTIDLVEAIDANGARHSNPVFGGIDGEPLRFAFDSIPVGRVTLCLRTKDGRSKPVVVEVPAGGLADTLVRFIAP
ncbi:MAG: sigma-70 family RNA polymerase sigma factor [Planctomycetes bacterium]|nr:sigma-70 family RNA polymerase sigma factor [Planctomycetota bacterium]